IVQCAATWRTSARARGHSTHPHGHGTPWYNVVVQSVGVHGRAYALCGERARHSMWLCWDATRAPSRARACARVRTLLCASAMSSTSHEPRCVTHEMRRMPQ
ncbi:hypothetical protein OAO87_04710, partial [bacterium]|nr:hypothetical protein [bacterium]